MTRPLLFQMPDRLIMGDGVLDQLPELVRGLGGTRVMVVTDPGLVRAGICDLVTTVLGSVDVEVSVFAEVEPDPDFEIVNRAVVAGQDQRADLLVGLGGGSSLDVAKVASVILAHDVDVMDIVGTDCVPGSGKATVLIPTTAGTGSEVTPIAVLSDHRAHLKMGVVSPFLYADVALVDPSLACSLPPHITAFTGVDALCHCLEAYTNRHAQPFCDTLALEGVRLVGANLRRAVACGDDFQARHNMALASLYGGLCLGSVNTTAVHALAYPLGGSFNVPHGVANSLLLPYVMEFNLISDLRRFRDLAQALGRVTTGMSLRQAAAEAIIAVQELCADVGIVSRMRDLGVPRDAIADMAADALLVTRLLGNNPRQVRLEDARRIYEAAW